MDDFSNDQDYFEVDYYKKNKSEKSSVQDSVKKCNDVNDTQIIMIEDIVSYVLLELHSQQVRPELKGYLNTDFVYLESMEDPPK